MTVPAPQSLVEQAVERCARRGGHGLAIADVSAAEHVRWADNAITTNGSTDDTSLTVVAVVDGRAAVVSGSCAAGGSAVDHLVDAALAGARRGGEPAEHDLIDGPASTDWARPAATIDTGDIDSFASRLAGVVERGRRAGTKLSGFAEQRVTTTYMATSVGLRLRREHSAGIADISADRSDGPSAWVGSAPSMLRMIDLDGVDTALTRSLDRPTAPASLPNIGCEVILTSACVADLTLHLYRAMGAGPACAGHGVFAAHAGRSPFGERLTEAPLTLRSDPHEPGLECSSRAIVRSTGDMASVIDNGIPLRATQWISDGVLTALAQTRQTACATGQPMTAAIDNVVLESPTDGVDLEAMIARTERALLVNSIWYLRLVDPQRLMLTGVTRHGVYRIERGEVVGTVPDFRFNESPVELLGRVLETGRTEPALPREWGGNSIRIAAPPLRVAAFGPAIGS